MTKSNIDMMADWVTARKRRTFEGAVRAIAKRRGQSLAEFMLETCDELCKSGEHSKRISSQAVMRRIVAAIAEEVAARQSVERVEIPGGEDSRGLFALPVVLPMHGRVLLGLLMRHDPDFFTGGRFAAKIAEILAEACAKCGRIGRDAFAAASDAVEWETHEDGRPNVGGRMLAAPGVLAMPDSNAPFGFRLLRNARTAAKHGKTHGDEPQQAFTAF